MKNAEETRAFVKKNVFKYDYYNTIAAVEENT